MMIDKLATREVMWLLLVMNAGLTSAGIMKNGTYEEYAEMGGVATLNCTVSPDYNHNTRDVILWKYGSDLHTLYSSNNGFVVNGDLNSWERFSINQNSSYDLTISGVTQHDFTTFKCESSDDSISRTTELKEIAPTSTVVDTWKFVAGVAVAVLGLVIVVSCVLWSRCRKAGASDRGTVAETQNLNPRIEEAVIRTSGPGGEALDDSGHQAIAMTPVDDTITPAERIRRGVKEALAQDSQNLLQQGRVAVDVDLFLDKCRAFADGSSDDKPGPLQYTDGAKTHRCIARECAEQLISHLDGRIEVVIDRHHGGLALLCHDSGEVKLLSVRMVMGGGSAETVEQHWWASPDDAMKPYVDKCAEECKKVADADGKDINTGQKWSEWWPKAPVGGASGDKEVHVWTKGAPLPLQPQPHDIVPVMQWFDSGGP